MSSDQSPVEGPTSGQTLMELMVGAAIEAGQAIMDIYAGPIEAEEKSDGSPVTRADQLAEDIILSHLKNTGIPVLAEESAAAGHIPQLGKRFFVVDPLDGTKEFIKRNGQFTVNIALVENGTPTKGIVLAPALDQLFIGDERGAFEYTMSLGGPTDKTGLKVDAGGPLKVVASRSHGHRGLQVLCDSLGVTETLSVGSSLKFCLVARGDAAIYPRFTPTCEWDTAAGQAVLQSAGGHVVGPEGGQLVYGKADKNFLNPPFVAAADLNMARQTMEKIVTLMAE